MANAGTWASTATSAAVLDADDDRLFVALQLLTGDPTSFAFGEAAVFGSGLTLRNVGDIITVRGGLAKLAVYAICDTANTSSGGYQARGDIAVTPSTKEA
jgi:hypothetical protein